MEVQDAGAVCRVWGFDEDGHRVTVGSGFLIAAEWVATAAHVVGERHNRRWQRFARISVRLVGDPDFARFVGSEDDPHAQTVVEIVADAAADWALLRLPNPSKLSPFPVHLAPGETVPPHTSWWSFGFPIRADLGGKSCGGETRILVPGSKLQLFSSEAAAGLGEVAAGYSGGPIICNGGVVGIMSSAEVDVDATWTAQQQLLDQRRRGIDPENLRTGSGTLYATPIAEVMSSASAKELAALAWWELVLPQDRRELPVEPFRDLLPYREEDAPIFFGRKQAQRDLYLRLTARDGQPLLLMCGQAGVGKSSLIQAGLVPYLRAHHQVLTARRAREGLFATLEALLERKPDEPWVEAWDRLVRCDEPKRRPPIVIIDQVEEAFTTQSDVDGRHELETFTQVVHGIFGSAAPFTRSGRIMLSYRKEWHSEIQTKLAVHLRPTSYRLFPLTSTEVEEGVRHVLSELVAHHRAIVPDPTIAADIANAASRDRSSSLAPILQILLTRLWRLAAPPAGEDPRTPRVLRHDANRPLEQSLETFLRDRIANTRKAPGLEELVDAGLALDVLQFHIGELGTSKTRTWTEVDAAYRGRPNIKALVAALEGQGLLIDAPGEHDAVAGRSLRLVHDALGPVVISELALSSLAGQRASRRIDTAFVENKELGAEDLQVLADGLYSMKQIGQAQMALVVRSSLRHRAASIDLWYDEARRAGYDIVGDVHTALASSFPDLRAGAIIAIARLPALREGSEGNSSLHSSMLEELAKHHTYDMISEVAPAVATLDLTSDEVRRLAATIVDHRHRDKLFGELLRNRFPPTKLPRRYRRRAIRAAGTLHMHALGTEGAAARERSIVGSLAFVLFWLSVTIPIVSKAWLAINPRLDLLQHIANLLPIGAFVVVLGVALGALSLTATLRATVAWRQRDRLWRGLANWRFGLVFSVVIAFSVAFGKLGTWTMFEGHRGIALSEYPREIIMATCIGIVAWASSLAAAALLLRATRPGDDRLRRYPLAIISACGIPALVTKGLFTLVTEVIPHETACAYGWSTRSSTAAWMVLLLGLGAMHGAVALGILRGATVDHARAKGSRRGPLALLVAFALIATTLNYQLVVQLSQSRLPSLGTSIRYCPGGTD